MTQQIEMPEFGISRKDLRRLQCRLLEIAVAARDVLEGHDIPYMIAYGTLLGAVRHGGFVPWDADLDFFLFDDTYDSAIDLLRGELPDGMFLEDATTEPKYFHAWAHIKDLRSECTGRNNPPGDSYEHRGIQMDLYRSKRLKRGELDAYLIQENHAYIQRRKDVGLMSNDEYIRRMKSADMCTWESDEDSDTVGYTMIIPYKSRFMSEREAFPLKRYRFEGYEFWGPNSADSILRGIYGDYMSYPPLEKRIPAIEKVRFLGDVL